MEHSPLVPLRALNLTPLGHRQRANGRNQHPGASLPDLASPLVQDSGQPGAGGLVELCILDRRPEGDVPGDVVPLGDIAEVRHDLGLQGELPRPVRLEGERVGVEVRGHVAAASRVRVRPPRAAQVVGLLDDLEGRQGILLLQLDGEADARHAGSDDEHVGVE